MTFAVLDRDTVRKKETAAIEPMSLVKNQTPKLHFYENNISLLFPAQAAVKAFWRIHSVGVDILFVIFLSDITFHSLAVTFISIDCWQVYNGSCIYFVCRIKISQSI
jgi:hypothetical protein